MAVLDSEKVTIGSIYVEDIELGAVEMKDASSDNRAAITAGGVLNAALSGTVSVATAYIKSGNIYNVSGNAYVVSGTIDTVTSITNTVSVSGNALGVYGQSGGTFYGIKTTDTGRLDIRPLSSGTDSIDINLEAEKAYVTSGNVFVVSGNAWDGVGSTYAAGGSITVPSMLGSVAISNFGGVLGSVQIAGGYAEISGVITNIVGVLGSAVITNFGGVLGSVHVEGGYLIGSVAVTTSPVPVSGNTLGLSDKSGVEIFFDGGTMPVWRGVGSVLNAGGYTAVSGAITNFGGVLGSVQVIGGYIATSGVVTNTVGILGSVAISPNYVAISGVITNALGSVAVTSTVDLGVTSAILCSGIWCGSPAAQIIGANAARKSLIVKNYTSGTNPLFIGSATAMTSGNCYPLKNDGTVIETFRFDETNRFTGALYGIEVGAGSRYVYYIEV